MNNHFSNLHRGITYTKKNMIIKTLMISSIWHAYQFRLNNLYMVWVLSKENLIEINYSNIFQVKRNSIEKQWCATKQAICVSPTTKINSYLFPVGSMLLRLNKLPSTTYRMISGQMHPKWTNLVNFTIAVQSVTIFTFSLDSFRSIFVIK